MELVDIPLKNSRMAEKSVHQPSVHNLENVDNNCSQGSSRGVFHQRVYCFAQVNRVVYGQRTIRDRNGTMPKRPIYPHFIHRRP
jgi:hypothetical protein